MSLDYARQTFFSGVREAVASDQPPRKRLEELYAGTIDRLRGNEQLREDIVERISRVKEARARISQLSEREVKQLLGEMVSIYDAIAAHLYGTGTTKHADV
jgi:N-glycosylase/DNA lyase